MNYTNKVRLRVNGLLVEDGRLLLVKLDHPVRDGSVWMPPGGGLEFGETLEAALGREFLEETALEIQAGPLRYIHEFIDPPLHAIEFYYDCHKTGGRLKTGHDPEHEMGNQLLQDVRFIALAELRDLPVVPAHIRLHFPDEYGKVLNGPKIIRS
ncbi:MAG: NUDIX domain-containing protein [Balneolales bacterium]